MRRSDYGVFYRHYLPYVHAYVQRRIDSAEVADLAAEVFEIAWRRRDDVPDDALPWLYRTARNVIGTRYRSAERLATLRQRLLTIPAEPTIDPAELTTNRMLLSDAFAGLTSDDQELLLLATWEGLDINEIAESLQISSGACAVRLHRARRRFNQALQDLSATDEHRQGERA